MPRVQKLEQNHLKNTKTALTRAENRLSEMRQLKAGADAALATAQTADPPNLAAVATARSEATSARELVIGAEHDLKAAQLAHESAQEAVDRAKSRDVAVAAAADAQTALDAFFAELKSGSNAVTKAVKQALTKYDAVHDARARFQAAVEDDDDLKASLRAEGITLAETPDMRPFGYPLAEVAPHAALIHGVLLAVLSDREALEREEQKRARERARATRRAQPASAATMFIDIAGGHRRRALELLGGYAANSSFFKETGTQREVARVYFEPKHEKTVIGLLDRHNVPKIRTSVRG